MSCQIYHYEAFSAVPGKGNPAGVVFDADSLSEGEMQNIAKQVGFNETVFVCKSAIASLRLRYFTPGHEIHLCGHATVASLFALYERGLLPAQQLPVSLKIETNAGILPIELRNRDKQIVVDMVQAPAQFLPFEGDLEALAHVLGIQAADFHPDLPITYGSTGTWTLLVPVTSLRAIKEMKPQNDAFPEVLTQMPRVSIHPFSLETLRPEIHLHGRHFSSPFSGTIEDPVTGTASGVMGAFMAIYAPDFCKKYNYIFNVEQGHEVNRDGVVGVRVLNRQAPFHVKITGTATFVQELSLAD